MNTKHIHELVAYLDKLLQQAQADPHMTKEQAIYILKGVRAYLYRQCEFAERLERLPVLHIAFRRLIPLVLTLGVSLGTSVVLSMYEQTLGELARFFIFAPLVSAVCGNHGLQTGTIVIRALAVGTRKEIIRSLLKELAVGLTLGLTVGLLGGLVATLWLGEVRMMLVVGTSLLTGIMTSTVMGALMPIVFAAFNIDPALVVGPAESTLQDIISYGTYLLTLSLLFR